MDQTFTHETNHTLVNYTFDLPEEVTEGCVIAGDPRYQSSLGFSLAMPEWEAICTAIILTLIILSTIFGNFLVIFSVFADKSLRIVQNFLIVSLAVADLMVAILVMPLNVAYIILGQWVFGKYVCKLWLTCDIMCCTSSILNICAIALDRYWAITDPTNYVQKRTLERVLRMIGIVWALSLIISSPPLLGWHDWPEVFETDTPCHLAPQPGFVIFSSSGSFFIPLVVMTVVYFKIYVVTKKRLRNRAKAMKIAISSGKKRYTAKKIDHHDQDSVRSEANQNEPRVTQLVVETECKKPKKLTANKKPKRKYSNKEDKSQNRLNIPNSSNDNSVSDVSKEDIRETTSESKSKDNNEVDQKNVVHQFIEDRQRISLTRERRAARTLGIIMGVFVICWLPFFIIYLVSSFCMSCCLSNKFNNFITWLGYINSTLNPLIYTMFNLDFRRAFKKLL